MWIQSHSKTYKNVKKEYVWRLWVDVNNWPQWHDDIEYCNMNGPFEVGTYFIMKPKGVSEVKIQLTEIEEGKRFTDCTQFWGAKMFDAHELEETPEGLTITSTLKVTGILGFLWVKLVAAKVAKTAPREMDALVHIARSHHE